MTGKDRSTDGDTTDTRRTVEPPQSDERFAVPLCGVEVDAETRCAHYDTAADVVALRFPCCDCYYPCFRCHAAFNPGCRRHRDRYFAVEG